MGKWFYQMGIFYTIVVFPVARERGNHLSDNISINQIAGSLSVSKPLVKQ